MGLRINNNIAALNSHRSVLRTDISLSKSLERLSSGFRINKAADDSAGLAVSMRFRAQIRSLQQASRNTSEANALLQVAEGAADQIANILSRMKELSTQAASSNTTDVDRTNINSEVTALEDEINRIANSTKYGTTSLINGSFGTVSLSSTAGSDGNLVIANGISAVDFSGAGQSSSYTISINSTGNGSITITQAGVSQVLTAGAVTGLDTETLDFGSFGIKVTVNSLFDSIGQVAAADTVTTGAASSSFQVGNQNDSNNRISFSLGNMTVSGMTADITVDTLSGAQTALTTIDNALDELATARSIIGYNQNRLGFAAANLGTSIENLTAAESVIRDADMAFETINFTKNQILLQAGTAMLAQANIAPQAILGLLS